MIWRSSTTQVSPNSDTEPSRKTEISSTRWLRRLDAQPHLFDVERPEALLDGDPPGAVPVTGAHRIEVSWLPCFCTAIAGENARLRGSCRCPGRCRRRCRCHRRPDALTARLLVRALGAPPEISPPISAYACSATDSRVSPTSSSGPEVLPMRRPTPHTVSRGSNAKSAPRRRGTRRRRRRLLVGCRRSRSRRSRARGRCLPRATPSGPRSRPSARSRRCVLDQGDGHRRPRRRCRHPRCSRRAGRRERPGCSGRRARRSARCRRC